MCVAGCLNLSVVSCLILVQYLIEEAMNFGWLDWNRDKRGNELRLAGRLFCWLLASDLE